MTTYVLSQHPSFWHVARYEGDGNETGIQPLMNAQSEEEALAVVMKRAQQEKPSQVLRISLSGESRIVAKFDA